MSSTTSRRPPHTLRGQSAPSRYRSRAQDLANLPRHGGPISTTSRFPDRRLRTDTVAVALSRAKEFGLLRSLAASSYIGGTWTVVNATRKRTSFKEIVRRFAHTLPPHVLNTTGCTSVSRVRA